MSSCFLGSGGLDGLIPGQFCIYLLNWLRPLLPFLLLQLLHLLLLLSGQFRCADVVALDSGQLIVSCDPVQHLSVCECYGFE